MAKIHLVETSDPLTDGWRGITMCGDDLASVAIGAMADSSEFDDVDSMLRSRDICDDCKKCVWSKRYLYFVRDVYE